MALNPCCCMRLQTGVRILAILDAVLQTISFVLLVLFAHALIAHPEEIRKKSQKPITDEEMRIAAIAVIIVAVFSAIGISLTIRLFIGAGKRNIALCRAWIWYKCIFYLLALIGLIINASGSMSQFKDITNSESITSIVSQILSFALDVYMIVCVSSYIKELEHEQWEERIALGVPQTGTPIMPYVADDASTSTFAGTIQSDVGGMSPPIPRSQSPSHMPKSDA